MKMIITEITTESIQDELYYDIKNILGQLYSGLISKNEAKLLLGHIVDNYNAQKALMNDDDREENKKVFLELALILKIAQPKIEKF